ncbi:hypothetical protein OA92_21270 [Marinomonas sp. SBI22]|uniref:type III secretion system inner rod subunit SctI n=1 Tax=unclassified Marinomonas TaxID=196814 RepID=UPI0007AFD99F|nr:MULTISPECIES: type III secretion system inner rod subunit SctI [unclassified Marinomonas]KZM39127.1 hypothetical protein OA92_21270 [Marinomonas sp. SBI22]KZM39911.1 hypothetical protein OA91_21125 [Marinomonas sp. SBI8L]
MAVEMITDIEITSDLDSDNSLVSTDKAYSANQDDVNFFESQLQTKPDPLSQDIIQGANSLSSNLAEKKHAFESALAKASNSADPTDLLAAARSLSEYSIQTSIVAKAAGKSSQAIDKMTNLN